MKRNKIIVPTTRYAKAVNLAGLAALAALFAYLCLVWERLPERIPTHFNLAGEIDGWGGKGSLVFPPILAAALFAGVTVIERFPEIWNTGVKVTEENRDLVYRELKNMLVSVKTAVAVTFAFLTVYSSLGKPLPVWWFFPADMALIFGPMLFFLARIYRRERK